MCTIPDASPLEHVNTIAGAVGEVRRWRKGLEDEPASKDAARAHSNEAAILAIELEDYARYVSEEADELKLAAIRLSDYAFPL